MAPIRTRLLKPHPLPAGATWFLSKEEAATHPGIQVELTTEVTRFYGVYRNHASLTHHTRNFLRSHPGAETYAQVEDISQQHFEFPAGLRKELRIPLGGRWFLHEAGARAAALSVAHGFVVSMILRTPGEDDTTVWALYPNPVAFLTDIAKCNPSFSKDQIIIPPKP